MSDTQAAHRAAEQAARSAYGRLVAVLAARWRDLAAAEDALSSALATALQRWPVDGVPARPEAWLMTVAQRELLQAARHHRVTQDPALLALFADEPTAPEPAAVPDERLNLMFVCAHPGLQAAMHMPLMLQAVLGLDAATIASAMLVSPAALAQRLVRAKARIRDAGLRFDPPEPRELPLRLGAVLEAIYGAYTLSRPTGAGATAAAGDGSPQDALADEALHLGRVVCALQPASAEAHGLMALMLHVQARRPALLSDDGHFVPLARQDVRRWRRDLAAQAERHLWHAQALRTPGRFQLEAAIQSAHAQRATTGSTPWAGIVQLYALLVLHWPGTGAQVGHAVALAESGNVAAGLAALQALPAEAVKGYQPYWVALAHVQALAGQVEATRSARQRAIGLTEHEAVRRYLAGL